MIGRTIGPYTVLAKLGEGGMGEVYRARDARLGRFVAIKALPAEFARDPERAARFRREARTLAAMNHPNIASVYGLEEADGLHYLVMELVEGETLAERLALEGSGLKAQGTGLPLEEALSVARQIAEALEAAHAKRVIHRDIKPANIKITAEGRVKVLDFGLAKTFVASADDQDSATTKTFEGTQPGLVVGTPSYMSPEQVRGQPLDERADVWAFGCVLFELLGGGQAFDGATLPDTLAAVLQRPPNWRALPDAVPASVTQVLRRCLEKAPERRVPDFGQVRLALDESASRPAATRQRGKVSALVVLPLKNLSGDPAQEFFAEGMTEALTWELGKLGSLRVISRTSARRYAASDKSVSEIADELDVDAVVEGSVARVGERVLVRAQLVEARTDTTEWRESYDRPMQDVLSLQGEIALAIAREIDIVVQPEERRRLERTRPVDPASYDAYLRGQFHWSKLTPNDLELALDYFQRAASGEPALGNAGIAMVWTGRRQMGLADPEESGRLARQAAEKALAADDTLAEVHYAVAICSAWIDWDWARMEREMRKALEIRPGYAEARAYLSHVLICLNRPDEALAEINAALEIDPNNELFRSLSGIVLAALRRFDEAITLLRGAKATSPGSAVVHRGLLVSFHMKNMFDEALAEVREWLARQGNREALAALDSGYASGGYERAMRGVADMLAAQSKVTYVAPADVLRYYCQAGDVSHAVDWAEIAFERRDPDFPYFGCMPTTDLIRDHPRFRELFARANLPL